MSLAAYAKKRNFAKTSEPRAARAKSGAGRSKGALRFVVQKHAASHLHYDFRLELGGTLKSWAVPKGMPFAHGEKRLAVHVEDHPVSYIDFEGVIPKGEYGGGTVMVWDRGTYEPESATPAKDLASGKLHFTLEGEKLRGAWYLVRIRDPEENQWLLIRGGEDMKPVSPKLDDTSVISARSMKAIGAGAVDSPAKPAKKSARIKMRAPAKARSLSASPVLQARPALKFVEPMMARLVAAPPSGDWTYEIKFDGFRALALKDASGTRLLSRNDKDLAAKFPEVAEAVSELRLDEAIIDGEIVALDPKGRSSFQLLQAYEIGEGTAPLHYYVFDLLHQNGESLVDLPLAERKARLEKLLGRAAGGVVRYSASLGGDVDALMEKASAAGLEGLIGKRVDSRYEIGRRSGAWVKLKLHQEQEFVIGGYTPPEGGRSHFGALLLGVYQKGKLVCVGKVGTGFNEASLRDLHARLEKFRQDDCPFSNLPVKRAPRYGQGITAAMMKRCRWARPKLVCQIRFAEWTRDDRLRQPVFLGLRNDKAASDVRRETPAPP